MTPRFTQKVIEISIERKSEGADQVGRQTPTRDDHRLGFGARYTTGRRQLESVILTAGSRGPMMNSELCT
jgi:hypothetical protein